VARENRRLAAIVAADVVGYSRLIGADEEATLQALRAHRTELIDPKLAEHGGRVANTAGDSLLLEFQSAVDAVRYAVGFQEAMVERNAEIASDKKIRFRVGINVGDVIAEGDDLLGDGVNIAARLEGICPPDGIMLSDDAHRQVRNRLDIAFVMDGVKGLKNIVEPITVWRWSPNGEDVASATGGKPAPPSKPSLAILPFKNLSNDPESEALADGLTEDIITGLSKGSLVEVTARSSTAAYKGQSPDIREVAAKLGASYVLEGSVRRAGARARITAQLVDAANGNHVWGDRFDRPMNDIFEMQDEIAHHLGSLMTELVWQDIARKTATLAPGDYGPFDHFIIGVDALHHLSPAGTSTAERHFQAALKQSPDLAYVHGAIGLAYLAGWMLWGDPERDVIEIARHHAVRARDLAPNDPLTYRLHGRLATVTRAFEESKRHADRALRLDPNNADLIMAAALNDLFAGDIGNSRRLLENVLEVHSDTAHLAEITRMWMSLTQFVMGDPTSAKATAGEISGLDFMKNLLLAACHAALGEDVAARVRATALLVEVPGFSVSRFGFLKCFRDPERAHALRDALLKAGVPE
jgi:adenylate cyclase